MRWCRSRRSGSSSLSHSSRLRVHSYDVFGRRFAGDRGESVADVLVWILDNPIETVIELRPDRLQPDPRPGRHRLLEPAGAAVATAGRPVGAPQCPLGIRAPARTRLPLPPRDDGGARRSRAASRGTLRQWPMLAARENRLARDALLRRRLASVDLPQGDDGRRARRLGGDHRLARVASRSRRDRRGPLAARRRPRSAAGRGDLLGSLPRDAAEPGLGDREGARRHRERAPRHQGARRSASRCTSSSAGRRASRSRCTGRTAGRRGRVRTT